MSERVIGVLGGMGPEATLAFYGRLIEMTPARRDQEHVRVIIDSNPKVPDRSAALLQGGESPVPLMASGLQALQRAGADFAVIPCVSAHAFLDELRGRALIPVLSIFDAVAEELQRGPACLRRVGLLATTGTMKAGLFQRRLSDAGLEVIAPEDADQAGLMAAIYSVKASNAAEERRRAVDCARSVAKRVIDGGAQRVVLGCTELPLLLGGGDLEVQVIDSLVSLARAALREAGREPKPLGPSAVEGGA